MKILDTERLPKVDDDGVGVDCCGGAPSRES